MPEEKSATAPHWTLEALGKVLEGLGFKELILQGIRNIGSRGKARKKGFEFHDALQSLETSLDEYLESLQACLKVGSIGAGAWPGDFEPGVKLRKVLWIYGSVIDLVEEIPQLKVYFPETNYLEAGRRQRLLQHPLVESDELDIRSLEQLRVRLPIIKRNIKQIKELAEQVREVLKKEWGFADAF
jgi:hypothetical protein